MTRTKPATAILEVAVHKTFPVLDGVPPVLTRARIAEPNAIHVVNPGAVPNPNWLAPGIVSARQQAFGDVLLRKHPFVLMPSTVSRHSWIIIFDRALAKGRYDSVIQEPFGLDTRLNPSKWRG